MKVSASLAALFASAAIAAPLAKRDGVTDIDILQFALTLEHVENFFYNDALSRWPESEFLAAGFTEAYYNNIKFIAHDEAQHVELLTSAISAAGKTPVAAGTYKFPYTDVKSFCALAAIIEGVGSGAYLGAAPLISSKAYLSVAGSILVTEALHTSVHRFNIGQVGIANPYGTSLGLNEVFTMAGAFIVDLPSTNAAIPVKAFPALTPTQGQPTAPGIPFTFSVDTPPTGTFYVTWLSGLNIESVPATYSNGQIQTTVSTLAEGQSYALLTNANVTGSLADSMVLAGPTAVEVTPNSPIFVTTNSQNL